MISRLVLPLVVAMLLASCDVEATAGSPSASVSPTPSAAASLTALATASVAASAEAVSPSGSPIPTSDPVALPEFAYSDILQVQVDGLAVRERPALSSPLMLGERSNPDGTVDPVDEVRLDAGSFVSVHLGPLPIDDIVWYLVWPAEGAQLGYSTLWWHSTTDDGSGVEPGWVAASVGADAYLTLQRQPDSSQYESWPPGGPRTLLASGTGDYVSPPLVQHDLFALHWAAAADEVSPCSFAVTLLPDDGEPLAVVDTSTDELAQELTGSDSIVMTSWQLAPGGSQTFRVSASGTCTWAVLLMPLAHD